jgi:hypothetical protein
MKSANCNQGVLEYPIMLSTLWWFHLPLVTGRYCCKGNALLL